MSKLPDIENVIKEHLLNYPLEAEDAMSIQEWIKEYGRQVRDITLEWAATNVDTETEMPNVYDSDTWYEGIDRQSILNGKIHKDLEI